MTGLSLSTGMYPYFLPAPGRVEYNMITDPPNKTVNPITGALVHIAHSGKAM